MEIKDKLTILADAAKYDASCASSGVKRKAEVGGIGNATGSGICHSYTPDGRCVSLLKILLTIFVSTIAVTASTGFLARLKERNLLQMKLFNSPWISTKEITLKDFF